MVSIVIPVYNAASYLSDMLESILRQSYKDIEILLVNDGSTDESSRICHKYADQYDFITVFDRENHGASASRNFGVQKANGEFVWFMDSDDILEKDALLVAVEKQKQYDADVVIGGMNFCFSADGKVVSKMLKNDIILDKQEFKQQYKMLFSENYLSPLWNKLFRRSIIIGHNIKMNEALCTYEDYTFCMDTLLNCDRLVCLSSIFYNYKLGNTSSLSKRYKENAVEMLTILEEKISGYLREFGSECASANSSLNNLMIFLAYECVKNEARHRNPYVKIRDLLHDKAFHRTVCKYKATGFRYRIVQNFMRAKQTRLLLAYLIFSKKA